LLLKRRRIAKYCKSGREVSSTTFTGVRYRHVD